MATGYSGGATTVSSLSDLQKKTNTDVKTAIKLTTEETKWLRDFPRENITVSGNENRVVLMLTQPVGVAMIPDGGNEAVPSSPAPTHGTFMPVQMNKRFNYTGLAQALESRSRGAFIEQQTAFQAIQAGYAFGRAIGLQTYGQSTGTVAVVRTTGSSGTTQVVPLKNAYGSSSLCAGNDGGGAQDTYLSSLLRVGEHVALIRSGAIVEFGAVTASPSATLGAGYADITFTSAITPTANDLIVFANADGDSTIAGTDVNNWPIGFTEALTASSVLGVTHAAWVAGSSSTASQRFSFAVKEKMLNECYNASGVIPNRFIIPQGVRRDTIAGERGARRYDSAETDIEGDLKAGAGQKYLTSPLAIPGTVITWFNMAYSKVDLSDAPDDEMSKSIFKLDKVQGKSQIAASYDYFYAKIPTSRGAMGYASNLTQA